MDSNTLSADTQRIASQLAQFEGAAALNIVARCFPRFAPAEGGTGFHQFETDFPCDRVPEALSVPVDADEVTITMQGSLGDPVAKPQLKQAVEKIFETAPLSAGWDVRVYFDGRQQSSLGYQIKVFTAPQC